MYKPVDPIAIPKDKIKIPNHFPKMNPANNPKGDPKPAAITQIIVNKINKVINKNKFDSFKLKKKSLLFFINS